MKVLVTQLNPTLCNPMDCSYQAPLSMRFSRQEYWSGLPFPSPGDVPDPGIKPWSPALQADPSVSEPPGKPISAAYFQPASNCWCLGSCSWALTGFFRQIDCPERVFSIICRLMAPIGPVPALTSASSFMLPISTCMSHIHCKPINIFQNIIFKFSSLHLPLSFSSSVNVPLLALFKQETRTMS